MYPATDDVPDRLPTLVQEAGSASLAAGLGPVLPEGSDAGSVAASGFQSVGGTSALVLCSTAEDHLNESFEDCMSRSSSFCKLLSACLAVLRTNVAAGATHLEDVLPMLNFNRFHLRGQGRNT